MSKYLNDIGVLVTRAAHQSSEIESLIENEGGTPYSVPLIKIASPESWRKADSAIGELDSFDWILFTSVNGVNGFCGRVTPNGKNIRHLLPNKIAAVGPKTRKRLEDIGLKVSLQPKKYDGDNLLKLFKKERIKAKKILFPGAEYGRDRLIQFLVEHTGSKTSDLLKTLSADIHRFADGAPQHDDITMVAFRFRSGVECGEESGHDRESPVISKRERHKTRPVGDRSQQ